MPENILNRPKTSCWIEKGWFNSKVTEITDLDSIIELSEGKFDPQANYYKLSDSTMRMLVNLEFYDFFPLPQYKANDGRILVAYAPIIFKEHVSKQIYGLVSGIYSRHLMEKTFLPLHFQKEYFPSISNKFDFWWDVENDFYLFLGEDKIELVRDAINKTMEYNNIYVGDWDELSKYYRLYYTQYLSEESMELLKPKKKELARRLIDIINYIKENKE